MQVEMQSKIQNMYKILGLSVLSLGIVACNDTAEKKLTLDSSMQKASYSYGVDVASRLKQQGIDLDITALNRGISDAYNGSKLALSDDEQLQAKTTFQEELRKTLTAKASAAGEKNIAEGKTFLEENAKKEGVITTDSGLQYKIISSGDGKQPTANDTVTTHYKGTLIDGREFDSSYKRNAPASFPVKGVIKGWTEALQLMHVGDKWQLFIPSDLAYGPSKRSELIEANSTLIFELELLGIK
jgi:FKBP-type peptidyl-prolyl cis-trans isomerase FklB